MRKFLMAGAAAALLSSGAQAALVDVSVNPIAGGPVTAVFAFADADDESELSWSQGGPFAFLFDNDLDPIGTTVGPFGAAGAITFRLTNLTNGNVLDTAVLYEGQFQAKASTNFADFGVGALDPGVAAIVAANPGGTFIGFEDRLLSQNSDNDFNDLIYYFSPLEVVVPAPAALGLFGLGLLGFAAIRRRG